MFVNQLIFFLLIISLVKINNTMKCFTPVSCNGYRLFTGRFLSREVVVFFFSESEHH